MSLKEVSKRYGVPYQALCQSRQNNGIEIPHFKSWNSKRNVDLEKSIIQEYQEGATGASLAKKYGYERKESIYQILESNEIERREPKIKTYYDENYFKLIDNHEKAYILGLIMADGNIIKNYKGFAIQLTRDDEYILEKIGDLIGASATHTVQQVSYEVCRKKEKFKNAKDMSRLTVHNRAIANDLRKLGVVERKTKILRYNNVVPLKFKYSFFRGLMDGDGTIGVNSTNDFPWVNVCATASEGFAKDIQKMDKRFKINKPSKNMWVVKVGGGKEEIYGFLEGVYKDKGDLYLRRKYEKVQSKIS